MTDHSEPRGRLDIAASDTVNALFGLSGKIAVVTGAAAGIGREIARLFAAAGARVVVADLNAEGADAVAAELEADGRKAIAVPCDTTSEKDVAALFETTRRQFGGVDILVNNAGIFPLKPLLDLSIADWNKVQRVNVDGYFLCARAAVALMKECGEGGRIINISSIASLHPVLKGYAAYGASKGAVNAFTRTIALEVAEFGITVNALLIGGVEMKNRPTSDGTRAPVSGPATQPGRFLLGPASAAKHAGVALFLAGDAASHMTGELVVADCGFLLT
jgi:NAD(P)-dependent dehydrogenase (short-subunit alcohol dehydrogenase family)